MDLPRRPAPQKLIYCESGRIGPYFPNFSANRTTMHLKNRENLASIPHFLATIISTAQTPSPLNFDLQTLRGDLSGGITSAVVTLPVALAFGVASGLGAAAGLYGAIAAGFFAALFGGTRARFTRCRGGGQHQWQRLCHRLLDAGCRIDLAPAPGRDCCPLPCWPWLAGHWWACCGSVTPPSSDPCLEACRNRS